MAEELVSILIPVYNRATLVGKAIESSINQTYKNIELIIINDGSNDNTNHKITRIKNRNKNDNLKIYYQKHQGKSVA